MYLRVLDSIIMRKFQFEGNNEVGSLDNSNPHTDQLEETNEPGQPHEALYLVVAYLQLFELLSVREVCRSLRDVVDNDVLLWLDIVVEQPLNLRLSDNILMKITSKAHGRLGSLALMNCVRITDDGLQRIVEINPHINKLYVPGCTGLTAEGIVKIVKMLTEHNQYLKSLRLHGLYGITKEHVETLHSCLKVQQEQQKQPSMFLEYRRLFPFLHGDSTRAIDVEICPKCNDVRLVFDCPRESCKRKRERPLTECKACYHCIPRCEECGGCVESEELGETVCTDFLCSDCWLRLPKCNLCNKPYCNRHADQRWCPPDSTGFICSVCHVSSIRNLPGRPSELEEDMIEDD